MPSRSSLLLPSSPDLRLWVCLLLAVSGLFTGAIALVMRARLVYASVMACTWLAMLLAAVWIYIPQFNAQYPIKSFAADIHANVAPHMSLRLCGRLNDLALRFNLGQYVPALPDTPEVVRYLGGDEEAFCVIESETHRVLRELTGRTFVIIAQQQFDRATLLLISNRQR